MTIGLVFCSLIHAAGIHRTRPGRGVPEFPGRHPYPRAGEVLRSEPWRRCRCRCWENLENKAAFHECGRQASFLHAPPARSDTTLRGNMQSNECEGSGGWYRVDRYPIPESQEREHCKTPLSFGSLARPVLYRQLSSDPLLSVPPSNRPCRKH